MANKTYKDFSTKTAISSSDIFLLGDPSTGTLTKVSISSYNSQLVTTSSFNNYTASISSSISGTINYIPKFTQANSIGNSIIQQSGNIIQISGSIGLTGSITTTTYIDFHSGSGDPGYKEGRLFYDTSDKTLTLYGVNPNGGFLQIGQEMYIRGHNATGTTITNGTAVAFSGSTGTRANIIPVATTIGGPNEIDSFESIGLTTVDISNGQDDYVTTYGYVRDLNTSAFNAGDTLYVSSSAGLYTNIRPTKPYQSLKLGQVIRSHSSQGIIFVNPDRPLHIIDINGFKGSNYSNGDLLSFDSASLSFINTKQLTGSFNISGSGQSQLTLSQRYTPSSTNDTNGFTGSIAWDNSFIYIKTSVGWKRSTLSTF